MKKLLLTGFALVSMATQAQTWVQQNSNFGTPSSFVREVHPVNATVAWGYANLPGTGAANNLQQYTRTSNGGSTWTSGQINVGNTLLQVSDLTGGDALTAWVAINGSNQGVWKTIDGGGTWNKQTTADFSKPASFPNTVYFFDLNNGVVMGDPDTEGGRFTIFTTTNGGTNWTRVPDANLPATSNEFGYTTIKAFAGDVIWIGTDLGRVLKSNNKGLNWTVSPTPIIDFGGITSPGFSGNVTVKDANNAWLMDQDGTLFVTADAGTTWDPVNLNSGTIYTGDLKYVPGTNNTLITGGATTASRGSAISYDGGENWSELTPDAINADSGITALGAFNASTIYGGAFKNTTGTGGMNKLGALLATSNNSLANSAVSVYPNPTRGQVNIVSKIEVKTVLVLDMNGKLVGTYKDAKQVDLSKLQSGVYMVNVVLVDGSRTATKIIKK